ncbi:MAG: hypothetical protein L0Y58_02490 [Verrucomicrobia subdivision 3 bacterium]|nr:hypothetical protein [Limisphaerales bacterium]
MPKPEGSSKAEGRTLAAEDQISHFGIPSGFGHRISDFAAILLWLFCAAICAQAADLTLKVSDKPPPKELSEAIQKLLQPRAIQLLDGNKPVLEYWLVKELSTQSKPESVAKSLDPIRQATVLGAVNVATPRRDYRGDDVPAGVYTMRFALQPQDGNHSGTSEFGYFGVLVPTKLDQSPDAIAGYKALMRASSKETSTDHPRIVSLRPANSAEGEIPNLSSPAPEHKSVRVKIPGKEGEAVVFEIVYEGKGHT